MRNIPFLTGLRTLLQRWRKARVRRRWLEEHAARNVPIAPDIEFVGKYPPYAHVAFTGPCRVESHVQIWIAGEADADPQLKIGSNVFIARDVFLGVYHPLTIGDSVMVGAGTYITTANHRFERRDVPMAGQGFSGKAVRLESDVWVGAHCVLLPGVTMGQGSILAAGSVLNENVPPYEIWGGIPAKKLKDRPAAPENTAEKPPPVVAYRR